MKGVFNLTGSTFAADYEQIGVDGADPEAASLDRPIRMDGRLYFPSLDTFVMTFGDKGQPLKQIVILSQLGNFGCAVPLSVVTARKFAEALLSCAEKVEAVAAEAATAALRKAAGQ